MKVAIYLRVSTTNQAAKGNTNKEGFSIPAQREACRNKAESINATVIKKICGSWRIDSVCCSSRSTEIVDDLCSKKGTCIARKDYSKQRHLLFVS